MSYCKKKGIETTVCYCLSCEYCLPPAERIGRIKGSDPVIVDKKHN